MRENRNSIKIDEKELSVSIGILGSKKVGKTVLLKKICNNDFSSEYQQTERSQKFLKDFKLMSFQVEARFLDYCKYNKLEITNKQ